MTRRHHHHLISLLMLAAALTLGLDYALAADQNGWQKLGEGLEQRAVSVSGTSLFSAELFFVRVNPSINALRTVRAAEFGARALTVRRLADASKALVLVNANFFDQQSRPIGLVVNEGRHFGRVHRGGHTLTGILTIGVGAPSIIHRDRFSSVGVFEAIQAGPRLVEADAPVRGLRGADQSSRRAGVCVDRQNRVILFCSSSLMTGVSLEQLQSILLDDSIGCRDALNLDGGGSAQMFISRAIPGASRTHRELDLPGQDPVPVGLGVFERLE